MQENIKKSFLRLSSADSLSLLHLIVEEKTQMEPLIGRQRSPTKLYCYAFRSLVPDWVLFPFYLENFSSVFAVCCVFFLQLSPLMCVQLVEPARIGQVEKKMVEIISRVYLFK